MNWLNSVRPQVYRDFLSPAFGRLRVFERADGLAERLGMGADEDLLGALVGGWR